MAWDPGLYLNFESERTRPAAELLARVTADAPKRVIDLGCGPGNSTALLARRWPRADLEGLDSSPEMLSEARKTDVKARWIEGDVSGWTAPLPYDVVFSNATLQWVPDHARLVPRLMAFVAEGGSFAFQVPVNFDSPSHALLREISDVPRWRDALKEVRLWHHVLAPDAYYSLLEPLAARIDIWETEYLQILEGEDAVYRWISGTGARPFINALSGEDQRDFIAEYKKRLRLAYPMRMSGRTLFPFKRLFVIAQQ